MAHRAEHRRYVTRDPESVDDSACGVLHVDMDAFFASVELLRHPELAGRPMMVAGVGARGVVLSATYEARRSGIRSGMPTGRARMLCPGLEIVPPDHRRYREVSEQVMAIFGDVTPLVEPLSVDEAFLDVSGARRSAGRPVHIARRLRERIRNDLGLTATVGLAASKFMAKLASGLAKPDGLLVVPPADVRPLLDPLPVRALWGVGPRTATSLESLGFTTVGEIARTDRAALMRAIGPAIGAKLHDLANGLDDRSVSTEHVEASIGAETTFETDLGDRRRIDLTLLELAEKTARRARAAGMRGRTVAIKVRYADFTTLSRSITLPAPTDLSGTVHATALALLDRINLIGRKIRLVGVRLEGLVPAGEATEQLTLGEETEKPGWREAEGVLDRVSARFGSAAVRRASLLPQHEE
ncbi:DNA polymerase IV [Nakamurella sp. YIM 132087]|uniref:DNA polymerase IV n=1 Tax=Nakamurella alba TaxID=2665158 RepID=A0A7K1FUL3_9ACTN|nr:DNA polymerase IV [Nakamurella alba]MTD16524.1 DNA polymerase IV [Nakamurella alba]